ncbi:hypothetical protein MnTg02_01219 [bacterium MnTg02]|nr:hypothetical protein MnTg02_01219 [bacterium MnTg02]
MGFERKTQGLIIVHHMLRQRHFRQRDLGLFTGFPRPCPGKERQRLGAREGAHLPKSLAAVEPDRAETVRRGKFFQGCELDVR